MKQLLPKILTAATYLFEPMLDSLSWIGWLPAAIGGGRGCYFFAGPSGPQPDTSLSLGGGGGGGVGVVELVILSHRLLPITAAFSMGC